MNLRSYHRPDTLESALTLLESDGAAVLAGGTMLNRRPTEHPQTVVDLQALGLDQISATDALATFGAMVRLQDLVDSTATPALVRNAARREGPNTLRNAATLGGVIACRDWQSELLASLLVHEAVVTLQRSGGQEDRTLEEVLNDADALDQTVITQVSIGTGGDGAAARTGRTPADEPIVSVVGRRDPTGTTQLAMVGVATVPVVVDPSRLDLLDPPGDFRGSPGYRRRLAEVLSQRVLDELG
jgi:CO/xanthine dehydrogenase FAD-binding subunit